jgi:hypothetical protein
LRFQSAMMFTRCYPLILSLPQLVLSVIDMLVYASSEDPALDEASSSAHGTRPAQRRSYPSPKPISTSTNLSVSPPKKSDMQTEAYLAIGGNDIMRPGKLRDEKLREQGVGRQGHASLVLTLNRTAPAWRRSTLVQIWTKLPLRSLKVRWVGEMENSGGSSDGCCSNTGSLL